MAREFAKAFYRSAEWESCRAAYMHSVGYLCERCKAKGIIRTGDTVHHKIHLSPENINDPSVTLNWDNLECVCRDCHAELHRSNQKRYKFRPDGSLIIHGA